MSTGPKPQQPKRRVDPLWWLALVMLLLALGFGGVRVWRAWRPASADSAEDELDEKKKQEEAEKKKQQDYDIANPAILPSEPKAEHNWVKPGHWTAASQLITANFNDFVGQSRISILKTQNEPCPI